VSDRLKHHDHLRAQGLARVSVLHGSPDATARRWARHYNRQGRAVLQAHDLNDPALPGVIADLARAHEAGFEAFGAWWRKRLPEPPSDLEDTLRWGDPHMREQLMQTAGLQHARMPQERTACALLLGTPEVLGEDPAHAVAVLLRHLPDITLPQAVPALLLAPPMNDARVGPWLETQAHLLDILLEAAPGAALGIRLPEDMDPALGADTASRAAMILREGRIDLRQRRAPAYMQQLDLAELTATRRFIGKLARHAPRLPRMHAELAALAAPRKDVLWKESRARSKAEALLFAALEAHPETRGHFRLNENVHAADPYRPTMEVDLLAVAAGIAVEVDGFHHFRQPDAYRADRRKDLALQEAGYTVLRFLAQDVTLQLERILDTIRVTKLHIEARRGNRRQ
jgi:very-short-patch-repair endonuclease